MKIRVNYPTHWKKTVVADLRAYAKRMRKKFSDVQTWDAIPPEIVDRVGKLPGGKRLLHFAKIGEGWALNTVKNMALLRFTVGTPTDTHVECTYDLPLADFRIFFFGEAYLNLMRSYIRAEPYGKEVTVERIKEKR